jgi:hypothetical protein
MLLNKDFIEIRNNKRRWNRNKWFIWNRW